MSMDLETVDEDFLSEKGSLLNRQIEPLGQEHRREEAKVDREYKFPKEIIQM